MSLPLSKWFMSIEQTLAKHLHFLGNGAESDALFKHDTDFLCQAFAKIPVAQRFTFDFVCRCDQSSESMLETCYF